ncbi:ABC transporter permease [Corticibacter populi]|uniref:ABC transporter permease n=1 Tax=Corticibacter populi TaxID=1550736 RepID=A0A3M6QPF0_9BURK|nr:ABC transporter permease [Corticibacter populi]RMX04940.1 ABC transporter permease [Corticibacter populi]RZS33635.1 putative spermidine/putrescine transport system permease protein [Corticibacter populi]
MHTEAILPPQAIPAEDARRLRRELRHAEWRKKAQALALIAPLALFLFAVFLVPIALLLQRSVDSPEVHDALPQTVEALTGWDRRALPADAAYAALAADLQHLTSGDGNAGNLARRLNNEISGYRSLITRTARALPLEGPPREALIALDARWGELPYWQAIAKNGAPYTPFFLLAALDLQQDNFGKIEAADPDAAIYRAILGRTLWIGVVATLITLAVAFPLAYWASTLSARSANLVMIGVLIPFWTSVLVRIAAWIVLLQQNGLINSALLASGIIDSPLALLFNRTGVYISMVHIMLPFMILPLYSVMKAIPPSYVRAAISLGSHPFAAFWRVYIPQTYAGVAAGVLLVFITTIGYYITPALLGGPGDQMVSYYIAYFTNTVVNWGMACALGALLLAATLVLYAVYQRVARPGAAATVR